MGSEDTKQDTMLKRIQITIAILAGLATLVLGVYNIQKNIFKESGPGSIRIYTKSESGDSLSGARIDISNSQNSLLASKQSDGEGIYTYKDLEPGSYFIKASYRGFEPQVLSVYVSAKKETSVEIPLRPLPSEVKQVAPAVSPVRSAIEEVGASWIKTIGKPKTAAEAEQK